MALKPCRECGKEVSTQAKECPHCGVSFPTSPVVTKKLVGIGCLTLLVLLVAARIFLPGRTPEEAAVGNEAGAGEAAIEGTGQGAEGARTEVASGCLLAFRTAAAVDDMHDTHQDMFPAFTECKTLEEWVAASEMYPAALDGVDPRMYARNVCRSYEAEVGDSPICQAVR